MIRITILVDGTVARAEGTPEHGFSAWVECGQERVLFDTGRGPALKRNAPLCGVDLARADAIVLSHGHYDHGDGLMEVMARNDHAPVYLHPDALAKRYSISGGEAHYVGLNEEVREAVIAQSHRFRWTEGPTMITDRLWVTGSIPRSSPQDVSVGMFFRDFGATVADRILDDQALVIRGTDSAIVVTGCAHSGVLNVVAHAREITGLPVRGVVGGFHLHNASSDRIASTVVSLRPFGIETVCAGHCTGDSALEALLEEFGEGFVRSSVGVTVQF